MGRSAEDRLPVLRLHRVPGGAGKIEEVAERLARLPDVFFVGIGTGFFDIIAAAVFRSNEHMHEFMITTGDQDSERP